MKQAALYIITFIFINSLHSQPINDNCENAIDITDLTFEDDEFIDHFLYVQFNGATVDIMNYSSEDCEGYSTSTSDHFPDVWFFTEDGGNVGQPVSIFASDSVELSLYIGTCGALYQSQCFTLSPMYQFYQWDVLNFAHDSTHSLYFQLKAPNDYNGSIEIYFGQPLFYFTLYFSYSNPASTTSINSIDNGHNIQVFPNPAINQIEIISENAINNLSIYNLTGKQVFEEEINANNYHLDLNQLSSGLYFIRAETKNGLGICKLVVQ